MIDKEFVSVEVDDPASAFSQGQSSGGTRCSMASDGSSMTGSGFPNLAQEVIRITRCKSLIEAKEHHDHTALRSSSARTFNVDVEAVVEKEKRRLSLVSPIFYSPENLEAIERYKHNPAPEVTITQSLRAQTRFYSFLMTLLGTLGLIFMAIQVEFIIRRNIDDGGTIRSDPCDTDYCSPSTAAYLPRTVSAENLVEGLRIFCSLSTICLLVLHHMYYRTELLIMKHLQEVPMASTLWTSPLLSVYIMEFLVFAIHPFPGMNMIVDGRPYIYLLVNLGMFGRILLVEITAISHSRLNTEQANFISKMTGTQITTGLRVKYLLHNRPTRMLAFHVLLLIVVCAFGVHLSDTVMCTAEPELQCSPLSLTDAHYLVVITVLTIGYGDFSPKSQLGRIIVILGGTFGVLCTAVIVAVVTNYMNFTAKEVKMNQILQRTKNKRIKMLTASNVVKHSIMYGVSVKLKGHAGDGPAAKAAEKKVRRNERKLYRAIKQYRRAKEYTRANDGDDEADENLIKMDKILLGVETIVPMLEYLLKSASNENMEKPGYDRAGDSTVSNLPASSKTKFAEQLAILTQNQESLLCSVNTLQRSIEALQKSMEQR